MTAAAGTCHSSSCKATDRCTFSSGHSTAIGQTRGRMTPPLQRDRLFSTRCESHRSRNSTPDSRPSAAGRMAQRPCRQGKKVGFGIETAQIISLCPARCGAFDGDMLILCWPLARVTQQPPYRAAALGAGREPEHFSTMLAHHTRGRRRVLANTRHRLGSACTLRLDRIPFGAPLAHARNPLC
jgi:hypothetical protein